MKTELHSENKYRNIEGAADAIFATDIYGNFQFLNPAAIALSGYTTEELSRINYLDLIVPEYRKIVKTHFIRQFIRKMPISFSKFPILSKSGEILWFAQYASLILEKDNIVGFHHFARNIKVNQTNEDTLKIKESFNSALFQHNTMQILLVDRKGKIIMTHNRKIAEHKSQGAGNFMCQDFAFKHEVDMYDEMMECIRTGKERKYEEIKYQDESFSANISPFPAGAMIISELVTAKNNENSVSTDTDGYCALIENLPVAVFEYDFSEFKKRLDSLKGSGITNFYEHLMNNPAEVNRLSGVIKSNNINSSARNLFLTGENWQDTHLVDFFSSQSQKNYINFICSIANGEMKGSFEDIFKKLDGSVFPAQYSWIIPDLFSVSLKKVYIYIVDATERKKIEESKQLNEKISRLTSIGIIASGTSHEINQPLTSIKLHINNILYWHSKNPGYIPEQFIKRLNIISTDVLRIDETICHMRSFWTSPTLKLTWKFDLNKMIFKSLSLIDHKIYSYGIERKLDLCESDLFISGNDVYIEHIVLNLILNAIQSLNAVEKENKVITIGTRQENEWCVLEISDNGEGIPLEILDNIFDPFITTKNSSGGMGIGLAIVKEFVVSFGGSVEAMNNFNDGATFIIRLPKYSEEKEVNGNTDC